MQVCLSPLGVEEGRSQDVCGKRGCVVLGEMCPAAPPYPEDEDARTLLW